MSTEGSLNKFRSLLGRFGGSKESQNADDGDGMIKLARLAGFFGAHGIWNVSDGDTLIPIFGTESSDGTRILNRLVVGDPEDALAEDELEAVTHGKRLLQSGGKGIARAALVYDGYVTLETGKTDALIIEGRDYLTGGMLSIYLPYRPPSSNDGFAVYRPKFVAPEVDGAALQQLADAFFEGVDSHRQASAVWAEHLDESI